MVKLQQPTAPHFHCEFLPKNYNFELPKLIKTIKQLNAKKVCLQLPDGLLKYAPILSDFIYENTRAESIILADVVYGACCIDDQTAYDLKSDLLIHFGHSCLIPVNECNVKVLYIFVDIVFDTKHLKSTIEKIFYEFSSTQTSQINTKDTALREFKYEDMCILGTIQFNSIVHSINNELKLNIPRISPLSRGEVLGCTAPRLKEKLCVFISDGRFHLEALMIQNPQTSFYRYCPFNKKAYLEKYDFQKMLNIRKQSIKRFWEAENIGIIIGILGRQGNPEILKNIKNRLHSMNKVVYVFQYEEIKRLEHPFIDAYVQICCPRLSIDWGTEFSKPLLSSFEVFWDLRSEYMMDFYSKESNLGYKNN
ncbi:2-(3-amino-3-carboxypropyl)histidine synthase subunit 1 [Cucumispora dikerogammari]|nr:2-(3-amino-3-carboxypropyl)histidine synthase subunit 1 [Cucumispora dikerogammari]